ncbi:two component transcriptional regulator, LytTR family [Flavobacterium swingsii]|jgi:two-component system LytT family response regulator|uniref:Two component transcriptional regulator, LytTR family n=1 Tax=Flavobacterium swingsii TaxID=498292 RepID=A0A1I0Z1Z9_9FLAO|nr:LytTR family DNA-binding domain-containing protein [Flavobacterium swingsii]SFB19136.1 two component transcriptional regulator, LytTR family [Flavobacterium swingsii]
MNKYKTIIIEDEKRAQILLQNILEKYFPNVEIMAIADDLPSGVKAIHKYKPDFVFLDIEMPNFSGLEILDFFNEKEVDFSIIFTTAYNHYAIEALKIAAVDYLLKPLNKEDIKEALERFEKKNNTYNQESFSSLKSIILDKKINKIAVPEGSQLHFIKPEDIVYIKADNSYSELYLENGKQMIVSRSIKNFEDGLKENSYFCRIHKSYLINTRFVEKYDKSNGGWITLSNKKELPVSSERIDAFLGLINKISR